MNNRRRQLINSKPGRLLKAGVYTVRLPNYIKFFEAQIEALGLRITNMDLTVGNSEQLISELSKRLQEVRTAQSQLDGRLIELKHSLRMKQATLNPALQTTVNDTMADDHTNDKFYKDFEDRFRGSEAMIEDRLKEYVPRLKGLSATAKKLPVLDIGCGRGEFLNVAEHLGLKAVGVDMNKTMVERANGLGHIAYQDDALSFLRKQKTASYAVVSGFHLVEHIPFHVLLQIFEECYRVIHPDGFVLFETPNPNNLSVGAANFYMDPSHIKPIPPLLLAFALETQGFATEVLELHPAHDEIKHADPVVEDIMRMVYGPLDYAVLATKH